MIIPFGIPTEYFYGGFGLPEVEECESAAEETHDNLVRSLIEAGGEIRELNDDKKRLIFALKEAVTWLDYFLTTERDDIYYDDINEVRCRAEYLLMDMEDTE